MHILDRRTLSCLAVLTTLLIGVLALSFNIQPAKAGTIIVPDDYPTIQEAINAASPGDTIFVRAGTYYEHVTIDKSLNLLGENKETTIIDGSGTGRVVVITANHVTVNSFTIRNSGSNYPEDSGVYMYSSNYNNITNNIITNNLFGIRLCYSSHNTLVGNNVSNNDDGIWLYSSNYNNLIENTANWNRYHGITVYWYSDFNNIKENNASNNSWGITVSLSSNNNLIKNVANWNTGWGMDVEYSYSTGNQLVGNTVSNNNLGVQLYESSGNILHHNNLINNSGQVYSYASTNTWDDGYPSGGNYWSDYTGVDANGDGIGDTPYVIDADNQDRYPLMHPWSSLPVHNINTGLGYATIQEAINAPETMDGHTIFVEAGTYYEHVVVNKSLNLIGERIEDTVIDGGGTGKVVEISANNVILKRFTVRNGEYGISGYNQDFVKVTDCNVTGNSVDGIRVGWSRWIIMNCTISNNGAGGIYIDSGYYNLIENNTFLSNWIGFRIYLHPQWCGSSSPGNNILRNNTFANNTYGIELGWAGGNVLRGNIMTNNNYSLGISGGSIYSLINDIDSSNIIDGKPVYYLVNQRNLIINSSTFPSIGYLGIVNSTNITVKDITLLKNKQGLLLAYTQNSTIINVTTSDNRQGIRLIESTDNVLVKSRASGNTVGIFLWRSDNNKITETTLLNNEYGIRLWHSDNNILYHNNFIENLIQVNDTIREWLYPWQYYYHYSKNIWDNSYPSGGNYWSDYAGVDADGDGIGDTPYIIDANNTDRYPLMNPWGSGTPVASFSWSPSTPEVGELVTFDASASMPVGGEIVSYEWDFGDGNHATGEIVTHAYGSAGTFTVTLNVTDSEGLWDVEQKQIEVKAPPPPLTVSISPPSASILVGESVTFTSTVSGGYTPYSYQWYLNGNPVSGATSDTWTFTPTESGIFYVYLKVTDDKGNTAQSDTARITVASVPVGGYSIPIQAPATAKPLTPYLILTAILTIAYTTIKRKTTKKTKKQQ